MKVLFDDVKDVFTYYGIWCFSREQLWYEYAWNLLDNAGLTKYASPMELTLVQIRGFTLLMIYGEYSKLGCGENFNYEFIDWQEVSGIKPFRLGQLAAVHLGQEINNLDEDDDEAMELAFIELVENERIDVVDMLVKHVGVGGVTELFVSLYLSCHDMYDGEDGDEDDNYHETGQSSSELEKYKNDINEWFEVITNDFTIEDMMAFEWLVAGTHRI